jgi:SAM-dependent MidA family methyltransferase
VLKARADRAAAAAIEAALVRLTAPAAMGSLFKVLALTAPGWPDPAGFESPAA